MVPADHALHGPDLPPEPDPHTVPPTGITLPSAWVEKSPVILCVAGRGPLDEAVSGILVQLLAKHGFTGRLVTYDEVSREKIETLDTTKVAIVCVSFLDINGSPAHLRYLVQRLRRRLPQGVEIIVGIWSSDEAAQRDDAARTAIDATRLTGSLEGTVNLSYRPRSKQAKPRRRLLVKKKLQCWLTCNQRGCPSRQRIAALRNKVYQCPARNMARTASMNENEIAGAAKDAIGKVKDGAGGLTGDPGLQVDGKIDQAAGKLQSKFGDATDRFSDSASAMADKASDLTSRAGSTLRDAAGSARRAAGQARETVYDAGARAGQQAGRTVQEQPLLSLIGIAAIGYAIGFLIHSFASPLARAPRSRRYSR